MTPNEADADSAPDGASGPDSAATPGLREITDARTLRALAHPVRIALVEELILGGAMTATEAAERIGESPTTCSFHLRQLAKYGFVEEAGGGRGRSRPWRMTSVGMSFASNPEDLETQVATSALLQMMRERQFARYLTWLETRHAFPPAWRAASGDSQYIFYLTADELDQLTDELNHLLLPRYMDRISDPSRRPAGSVPVEMTVLSYPIQLPPADAGTAAEADTDGDAGPGRGSEGAAS